jgi:hypothetical protein
MRSVAPVVAIVALLLFVSRAEGQKAKPVTIENLVTAQPVPEGYAVGLNELKDGEKLLGHQLAFAKEGAVSKVMVSVEERKLPDKAHKVTALKGYINGTAKSFAAAGLKLVKKDIPDIEKVNVNKRTKCSLTYKTAEGGDIFIQMQILFTDVGYNIMVVADNEGDYKALTKWAETIQPVKKESKK